MFQYSYCTIPGLSIVTREPWSIKRVLFVLLIIVGVLWLASLTRHGRTTLRTIVTGEHIAPSHRHNASRQQHYNSRPSDKRWQLSAPAPLQPTARRRHLTKKQKQEVLQRYHHQCAHCHVQLNGQYDTDFDHIVGLFHTTNGQLSHQHANHTSNFQPLCLVCHRHKTIQERKTPAYRQMLRYKRLQRRHAN